MTLRHHATVVFFNAFFEGRSRRSAGHGMCTCLIILWTASSVKESEFVLVRGALLCEPSAAGILGATRVPSTFAFASSEGANSSRNGRNTHPWRVCSMFIVRSFTEFEHTESFIKLRN